LATPTRVPRTKKKINEKDILQSKEEIDISANFFCGADDKNSKLGERDQPTSTSGGGPEDQQ
jgi:hypothetical protein